MARYERFDYHTAKDVFERSGLIPVVNEVYRDKYYDFDGTYKTGKPCGCILGALARLSGIELNNHSLTTSIIDDLVDMDVITYEMGLSLVSAWDHYYLSPSEIQKELDKIECNDVTFEDVEGVWEFGRDYNPGNEDIKEY